MADSLAAVALQQASGTRLRSCACSGRCGPARGLHVESGIRSGVQDLTVGIMALVAQHEREAISRRTRERGNPNGAEAPRRAGKGGAPQREVSPGTPIGMRETWRRPPVVRGAARDEGVMAGF